MNDLAEVSARKKALLEKSDAQRIELAQRYYSWQARTQVARQVTGIFRNPLVLAGLGLFLLKMPWRRAYRMGGWAWKGWRMLNLFRRIFI